VTNAASSPCSKVGFDPCALAEFTAQYAIGIGHIRETVVTVIDCHRKAGKLAGLAR